MSALFGLLVKTLTKLFVIVIIANDMNDQTMLWHKRLGHIGDEGLIFFKEKINYEVHTIVKMALQKR